MSLKELKIPNKYFFDFLRGCFDGDGSFYSYWDLRWTSSFMFYTSFNSGSLSLLKWLRSKLKNALKIEGHIARGHGAWKLCYAKKESRILFSKMYYKRNLPCLIREYKKLKNHLETDDKENKHILKSNGRVLKLEASCV